MCILANRNNRTKTLPVKCWWHISICIEYKTYNPPTTTMAVNQNAPFLLPFGTIMKHCPFEISCEGFLLIRCDSVLPFYSPSILFNIKVEDAHTPTTPARRYYMQNPYTVHKRRNWEQALCSLGIVCVFTAFSKTAQLLCLYSLVGYPLSFIYSCQEDLHQQDLG